MFQAYAASHPFGWDRENLLQAALRQAILAPHSKSCPDLSECLVKFATPSTTNDADTLIFQLRRLAQAQQRYQALKQARTG